MIPLRVDEVERARSPGRLEPTPGRPSHRRQDRLAARRAGRPLRRRRRRRRLRRRRARAGRGRDARAGRRLRGAGRARRRRSRAQPARVVGITGSTGKTSTKDILAALCAPARAHRRRRGELQQRARRAADALPPRARHRGLRRSSWRCAGSARSPSSATIARPDVGVITRSGPCTSSSSARSRRRAREGGAARRRSPGGVAIVPADAPLLEPYLRDVDRRRFGRGDVSSARSRTTRRTLARRRRATSRARAATSSRAPGAERARGAAAYDALGLPLDRAQEGAARSRSRAGAARSCRSRRRRPDQRRVQREPGLDARRARPPRRRAGTRAASRCSATWPSSATRRATTARSGARSAQVGVDVLLAVGPLARHYVDGPDRASPSSDAPTPRRAARSRPRPARRLRARQGVARGAPRGVADALAGAPAFESRPHRRDRRDGPLDPARPEVHRVPAPQELGQHIREEGRRARREAGHADDGRRADRRSRRRPAFLALSRYTTRRADRLLRDTSRARRSASSTTSSSSRTGARSACPGRWKLLLLGLAIGVVGYLAHDRELLDRRLHPARRRRDLPLSVGWYVLVFFVIAGAANGVNLTDGIDGLAAGTGSSRSSRSPR